LAAPTGSSRAASTPRASGARAGAGGAAAARDDDDALGLDVSMHEACLVHGTQAVTGLDDDADGPLQWEALLAIEQRAQVFTTQELHD